MATVLKATKREFLESPNKIDPYRLFTDSSRAKSGINPVNLNFDLRQLDPGRFSAPYHFHRHAEELFMIVSGSVTLRTPEGLEKLRAGDLVFFEMGESGAHQLYNHTEEPCVYLDIRTYMGFDVAEYPDSGKLLMAPSFEIFYKERKAGYFEGEEHIREKWQSLTERDDPKSE
ncbi:MAG: cupin domain-containing protein [Bacteroidota bacterium]